MNIAILGAGTIIPAFIEAAKEIPSMKLYAIFGRAQSAEKLHRIAGENGIETVYHDYAALLADPQVDVVYNALPNHLHYSYTKQALLAGKHVILEKPFASSLEQAKDLVETAQANGVIVFEAISNQYMPNYLKTKELAAKIGDVKIVQLNYSQYSRRYDQFKAGSVLPVFDPKQSGGALMDINVYNIHFVTGIFGKPEQIFYTANVERGIDTSGILVMQYPTFQCVCIGAKDCKAPLSINIQGDLGYLHSDSASNSYTGFTYGMNNGASEDFSLNEGKPRLYYELRTFAELAEQNDRKQAANYLRHTLEVQEILDEARKQAGIEF